MSYYGASGTAHKYIATDQPLYGLGSLGGGSGLGAFGTDPAPSPYVPPGIQLARQDAACVAALPDLERILTDSTKALQTGVACPNLPPAIPATAVAIGNVLKQWADEGSFVIMRQGAGSCGIMGTQGIASWSFYKFPKESIGGILNDPNSFVLYLPHNEASTDFSWGKYKTYLNPGAGSTVNPTLPVGPAPVVPVVPDLPFKVPAEEQGLSGKAKLAIAAFVAFVAYKLFKKPSYSTNEYEYEDLCLSDPAERPPEKKMCSTIWRGRRVSSSRTSSAGRWTGTSRRSRGP
jgi:hypothetical protein